MKFSPQKAYVFLLRRFLSFLYLCLFIFFFLFFFTLSAQTFPASSSSASAASSSTSTISNGSNPVELMGFNKYPNGKLGYNFKGSVDLPFPRDLEMRKKFGLLMNSGLVNEKWWVCWGINEGLIFGSCCC